MLVTGSSGFIGAHLLNLTNGAPFDIKNSHLQNVCWYGQVMKAATGHDVIVHLAAEPGVQQSIEDPMLTHNTNVNGTFNVLDIARRYRKRVLFASSAAAENTESPYAVSKRYGELLAQTYSKNYALSYVAMRFSNVYGPGSEEKTSVVAQMCKDAIKGEIHIYGDGNQTRDFIHVGDVVKAINYLSVSDIYGILDISSGERRTVNEVAEIIAGETGCKVKYHEGRRGDVFCPAQSDYPRLEMDCYPFEDGIRQTLEGFL